MSKELRDEYRRLHPKLASKKAPDSIVVCLCKDGHSINCNDKDCPCPLHFATWKEYLKSKKPAGVVQR